MTMLLYFVALSQQQPVGHPAPHSEPLDNGNYQKNIKQLIKAHVIRLT